PGGRTDQRGGRVARPRRAGALPRRRGGRRRGRARRRRPAARRGTPVGTLGRPPHLHHRRHGLASPGRGLRRGLGAASRPGLLRDLRGSGLDHGLLAAAPGHRRRALHRPHRAHALQRHRGLPERRRPGVLLRQPPARAGRRAARRPGRGEPAGRSGRAGRLVRRLLLPDERRPHPGQPARLPGHQRRRRPADPPVRALRDPRRAAGRAAGVRGRPDRLSRERHRPGQDRGRRGRALDAHPARPRLGRRGHADRGRPDPPGRARRGERAARLPRRRRDRPRPAHDAPLQLARPAHRRRTGVRRGGTRARGAVPGVPRPARWRARHPGGRSRCRAPGRSRWRRGPRPGARPGRRGLALSPGPGPRRPRRMVRRAAGALPPVGAAGPVEHARLPAPFLCSTPTRRRVMSMSRIRVLALALVTAAATVVTPAPPAAAAGATLTVDVSRPLRPVPRAATGGRYGLAENCRPPGSTLLPIKVNSLTQPAPGGGQRPNGQPPGGDSLLIAPQADRVGAGQYIRMPDIYPNFPYRWVSWNDWLAKVDTMVRARLHATTVTNVLGWELWNEPDYTWDTAAAGDFNEGWVRTYRAVRALDQQTPIVGPSTAVYSRSWM